MNRSEDNTCEYCRGDLPRGSATHFCNEECFEANEREAREQARAREQDEALSAELVCGICMRNYEQCDCVATGRR